MKNLFILIVLLFCSLNLSAQSINVMTYNLRFDNPNDGENSWPNRKEFLLSQITYFEPDIFGTQEGLEHQILYLNKELKDYSFVGIGRDEGSKGEFSALFYNHVKLKIVESSTFWLSETPNVPSVGWDAALNRICTFALMEDIKSQNKFWVFNTHFDHKGSTAREKSAELIIKQITSFNKENYPVILMGDFNLRPDEKPILELSKALNDSKMISQAEPFGPDATFGGFNICEPAKNRIDYIFISKENIIVNKYAVIVSVQENKYPSDHFPVLVNITINKK